MPLTTEKGLSQRRRSVFVTSRTILPQPHVSLTPAGDALQEARRRRRWGHAGGEWGGGGLGGRVGPV